MKKFFLLIFITSLCSFSFGQGTIRGKVTDGNGEALIGATVVLKSNRAVGTVSDFDGNYSLKVQDSVATLIVSFVSFKTMEETIHLKGGKAIIKDFILQPSTVLKDIVVTTKADRSGDKIIETLQANSATSVNFISGQMMAKTGAADLVVAVGKVSGVSTSGGFITVRGIGDRYIKTTINGSRIPTLDPFTNNIKLDMFPPSLVDNVIITKTASPDLPGDWAGSYLSVQTKDYPENLAVKVETTFGYNNQSSFQDVLTSQKSATDWLGYDNGFRDYDHKAFIAANITPTQYQEFVALGLGDYYKSIGVTSSTPWNETYYKLGLVELGILAKADMNDNDAFKKAKTQYENGPYKDKVFQSVNEGSVKSGKTLPNNWNTFLKKGPLNFTQSFSVGNQTTLFGKQFGYLFGFRYGSSIQYDPNSVANRASVFAGDDHIGSASKMQNSRETNAWSALLNLAYKFSPNHSITALFMPNLSGVNNVRNEINPTDETAILHTKSQFYEQRKQLVYQLKSEHYFPGSKIKVESNASYTKGKSSAPDFKNLRFTYDPSDGTYQIGGSYGLDRFFRYLDDDILDTRVSAEMPIPNKKELSRKIKIGGAYQLNERKSDIYNYYINFGSTSMQAFPNGNVDAFFNQENFGFMDVTANGVTHKALKMYYRENGDVFNHTFGNSSVWAGFVMTDYTINPKLRASGGLRVEKAKIYTDVFKYDSLGLAPNDERRISAPYQLNPGSLNEFSFLPSVNLIYKIKDDAETPITLRANYSKTVARPSIRELSSVSVYDYEFRDIVTGNPDLKMVEINNYDLRFEKSFKKGDNISFSVFYKNFNNHIELVQFDAFGYSWQNVEKSRVSGIEIEGRKAIIKNLEFRTNITLVNSVAEFQKKARIIGGESTAVSSETIKRSMFGQAPYIINGILSYTADSLGLTLTASYNLQGPRLAIASNFGVPDVYELPRQLLDFKVTKKLGEHFSTSLTIRDIFNSPIRRAYKYPEGWALDYDRYTYGTNYVLGVSYKL